MRLIRLLGTLTFYPILLEPLIPCISVYMANSLNVLLISELAKYDPRPKRLTMLIVSSNLAQLTEQSASSIKSVTEFWVGYERWRIALNSLFAFLGTTSIGETRRFVIGHNLKGPVIGH